MELKGILTIVRERCAVGGEVDAVALAHAVGLSLEDTIAAIERMDAEGLAMVEEYGFSCSVEYSVIGLTEAGLKKLEQ